MLELSEISSQAVLERNEQVTALQIARQAVANSGILEASHLDFTLKAEEGAGTPFVTDQRASERILELLLDNAIKFTQPAENLKQQTEEDTNDKKQVTLTIGTDSGKATFVVEDNGIGIPEEEAEHIFDEFVQLDEYYDGTGIGLTVARSLARRLGGDVVLDTHCTGCTRFVATLAI